MMIMIPSTYILVQPIATKNGERRTDPRRKKMCLKTYIKLELRPSPAKKKIKN
jgi:hypothetical protein